MTFEKKHYAALGIIIALLVFTKSQLELNPKIATQESSMGMAIGSDNMVAYDVAPTMTRGPMPPIGMPSAGQTAATVDQKIIKTASLELSVDDVGATASRVESIAKSNGGFVQQTDVQERSNGTKYGYVIIRVPATAFELAKEQIKNEAKLVKRESINSQDVTEQYTDLEAQLRNAQAQERTYLAVLDKARTVEEILNVQSYLGQIRGQIESLQGRIQYLKNVTELSTITVTLSEEASVRVPTKEFRPGEAIQEAVQSLIVIAQSLILSLIWLVIVGGGILIPLALFAWIIYRLFFRRK